MAIEASNLAETRPLRGGPADPNRPQFDPNVQAGMDQFGNPVNGYGLPLGQSPPAWTPPQTQATGGDKGWAESLGDAFSDFGDAYMGNNAYRPQTGAPTISSPGMTAVQMQNAGMDTAQADADRNLGLDARGQQSNLGNAIMARALGQGGPSVAELQMRRGIGQAQQAAASQAASARGIGRGLAAYGAANAQANLASQGVQDASALRAQEQIAAQGLAQKSFTDQRMQDLTSRGMSIQQAQAIMDAENRAREANMNATNRARETSLGAHMQAQTANLAADTNLRGQTTQITEGEAERKQKGTGGIVSAIGSAIGGSDVRMKQDVQPLLYSPNFATVNAPPDRSVEQQSRDIERDRQLGQVLQQRDPNIGYSEPIPPYQPQAQATITPYQPPPAAQQQGGGGIGDILGGLGANLSDKRAKNVAFSEGLKAGMQASPMVPGYAASMPSPMTPGYPPRAVSDKKAKYSYSDERAKELEGENAALKQALSRMGNDTASQIRGDAVPTAAFPDVSADDARKGLGPVQPYQYSYKPEFAAQQGTDTGPRAGVMAQEMEKSPAFKSAVVEMPNGMLGLDNNRLLHADTAMIAGQDKRLTEMEEQNRRLAAALQAMGNQRAGEIRDFR